MDFRRLEVVVDRGASEEAVHSEDMDYCHRMVAAVPGEVDSSPLDSPVGVAGRSRPMEEHH